MASKYSNAHDVYEALRRRHELLGPYAQVQLIEEALDTRFSASTPVSRTLEPIKKLHRRFTKMGQIDDDTLLIILIMNALNDNYFHTLQSAVDIMLENPSVTSKDVKARVLREEQLLLSRGDSANPLENTAVVNKATRPICANCKRRNHRTKYCIAAGGRMAGKTIDEARATQDAARKAAGLPPKPPRGNRGNTATPSQGTVAPPAASDSSNPQTVTINGMCYMLVSDSSVPVTTPYPRLAYKHTSLVASTYI